MVADVFDRSGNINLDAAIEQGFFSFVLLAISMGFLALLTPCVFPMIPITVSYFTHQGEIGEGKPLKNATIYTLGIIGAFSILGFILALTLGASGANQLASNPWINLFIAALFCPVSFRNVRNSNSGKTQTIFSKARRSRRCGWYPIHGGYFHPHQFYMHSSICGITLGGRISRPVVLAHDRDGRI